MSESLSEVFNPLDGGRPEMSCNLYDGSEEQVSIIVVHRDRPEYLNICLQSIAVTSLNNNYEIIVVDNGSVLKDSIDFLNDLEEQGECKVVRNKENVWWSKAANMGARAADKNSKYFIFLHADVVVTNPAWIDLMMNVSESQGSGLVGVSLSQFKMQGTPVQFVEDWCVMLTRECWQTAGPWPEELPLIGAAFVMSISAQMHNFKPQAVQNQIVHHYKVFGIDVNDYERLAERAQVTIPTLLKNLQAKQRT